MEGGLVGHRHVVIMQRLDFEVNQIHRGVVLSESHVLDVHIEQFVPVLLNKRQVHRVVPCKIALRGPIDRAHCEVQLCEIKELLWVHLGSEHLDCAIVRVEHRVRVLFLDHNHEVVSVTLVPDTMGSESDCGSIIVVVHEWRISLTGH